MQALGRSRRRRGVAGISLVATSSALLAGCVAFTGQQAAQLDGVGDVAVTLDLCQDGLFAPIGSGDTDDDGCTIADEAPAGKAVQLFITYAIPESVPAPGAVELDGGSADDALTPDPSSTSALVRDQAAPAGYKFVTYRSHPTPAVSDDGARKGSLVARFDASGLSGDFAYGAAASWRFVSTDPEDTGYSPDRAVECGSTGTGVAAAGRVMPAPAFLPAPGTACLATTTPTEMFNMLRSHRTGRISVTPDPTPLPSGVPSPTPTVPSTPFTPPFPIVTGTPLPQPTDTGTPEPQPTDTGAPTPTGVPTITTDDGFTLYTVPVNRLALASAAEETVTAGGSATFSFGATSHLAGSPVSIPLSGTTTAPGATVETAGSLEIGDASKVKATVKVPASVPAGDYVVTLNAGERSGKRSATATLHVKAADAVTTPAPTAAPTATPAATPFVSPQAVIKAQSENLARIVQRGKKTRQLRRGAATVPVQVTGPGTVRVTILGRKKEGKNFPVYAVGEIYAKRAGSVDVTIKPTDLGLELLRGDEPVKATLVVRFRPPTGAKIVSPGVDITLD